MVNSIGLKRVKEHKSMYSRILFNRSTWDFILKYGKCSKISNTKIIIFSAVRNFRNYVSEKVLVFVILECGVYHEQKLYICM